ncbi:MAG TPA: hypothetical protein VEB21_00980 [Terriglobales bacterium]|nr:hypothetical protein [Terriglobales bacterium]
MSLFRLRSIHVVSAALIEAVAVAAQMGQIPHGAGHAAPAMPAAPIMQPMVLTESKLDGFFAAVEDLQKLSEKTGAVSRLNPNNPTAFGAALSASGETGSIIQKHGFADVTEFQRVGFNAALANAVLDKGGKDAVDAEIAKAKAEQAKALDGMRAQLNPEQLKMMEAQMASGMAISSAMQDVPPGNVELIKKYSAKMKSLGKK